MRALDTTTPIGFVGLGKMGANMARCLKDKGFRVAALYDTRPEAAASLADELGSEATPTLERVTARCEVVFTVVPDDAAMRAIFSEEAGAADTLLRGPAVAETLFINCATITPEVHVALAERLTALGAHALECPMASSIPQAREGKLFLICAGQQAVYAAALPVLEALSQERVFTGGPGTAATMKALVNMVMNINTAALAEGLGLADALGLDLAQVCAVFARTGANSRVLETDAADMISQDFEPFFSCAHAAKDSGIALRLGEHARLPMKLAAATAALYNEAVAAGYGELDKSGIAKLTFRQAVGAGV